jgi:hypothetical protein
LDAKRTVALRFRPSVLAEIEAVRGGLGLQAWFDEAVADRLAKGDPARELLLRVGRQMPPPVFDKPKPLERREVVALHKT